MPPPYTTLAGFRRARRAQSKEYLDNKRTWNNSIADSFERWEKLPKPKANNKDIIESKGYENKFKKLFADSVSRKITVSARETLRENNRKNEETAIAITLTGERIFKKHSNALVLQIDESMLNKQPMDSIILIHNHPQNDTFSAYDLRFMSNRQIHTLIAACHNGKIFSLRTNCGETVDGWIVSEYNRYVDEGETPEIVLSYLSKKYGWEYKEL